MIGVIDEYRYELMKVSGFTQETIENYVSCIVMFHEWIRKEYQISPVNASGNHLREWIMELKNRGLSYSRLEHHRSALRSFYAMLLKMKVVKKNIASALP